MDDHGRCNHRHVGRQSEKNIISGRCEMPRRKKTRNTAEQTAEKMRRAREELERLFRQTSPANNPPGTQRHIPFTPQTLPAIVPKPAPLPTSKPNIEPTKLPGESPQKPIRSPAWLRKQQFKKNFRRGRI